MGPANASDLEVLRFAASRDYLLLTHDLGFGDLLMYSRETRPSVLILREIDLRPEVSGERLLQVLLAAAEAIAKGAIGIMDASRVRVRLLPLV
ncbi:DUF5615 family PIN-like protein [Meiothermus rufus]|uniref:DUF5615 family PIN-like protein n=1 Tax=Meiothermus rufus TaxID=604332 RepID=UPI00040005D5|nr:DUF5615 family PIN-like protein [Meiothermus rufus]